MNQLQHEEKVIEAYELVKKNDRMPVIHAIKRKLAFAKLVSNDAQVSSFIFGKDKQPIEEVVRQLLLVQVSTRPFNGKLLRSYSLHEPLTHELPPQWRKILVDENIRLNRFGSFLKFQSYIFIKFMVSIQRSLVVLASVFFSKQQKTTAGKKYIQFCDLTAKCIPFDGEDNYTIINWYTKWDGKANGLQEIHHTVNGKPRFGYKGFDIVASGPFAGLITNPATKWRLLFWFIGSVFISLFSFLRGRWINPLLLHEAFLSKIMELAKDGSLAQEYLFSISSFAYRPLWTYAAQKKGSLITNYSYASSFGGFKTKHGYVDIEYYFDITTWPRLIYWTKDLVAFIKTKVSTHTEVICAMPVYYSDHSFEFPSFDQKVIGIFDVSPIEPYDNAIALPELEYRTFENGKQFLLDIYEVFGNKGFAIFWKRKRGFASIHSKNYIDFCNEFEKLPGVTVIHPDVSAFRVVEKSDYCISMPFTSTAFIAEHFHKPSVFYDTTQILSKDDRAAQGIPLIAGRDELQNWKEQLLKENHL